MGTPEVSVVVAAYNASRTLGAQLEALAVQQVDVTWDVLVCDNGSTDGTAAVVREAAAQAPEIRLVDASGRRGPAAARNVGARATAASLLAFCDADDVVAPGWLAALVAGLRQADVVAGRSRRPEYNSRPDAPVYFSWGTYRVPFFPYLDAANAGNLGVRRAAFVDVDGFDESLRTGEDLDLCWRLQLAGYRLAEEPGAVVTFRNRDGLAASAAQTYAYGAGNRQLAHKYALVAAAYRAQGPGAGQPSAAAVPTEATAPAANPGRVVRLWHKARRTRRPSDLTNAVRTAATWAGYRFGRVDRAAPQVRPPADLPPWTVR